MVHRIPRILGVQRGMEGYGKCRTQNVWKNWLLKKASIFPYFQKTFKTCYKAVNDRFNVEINNFQCFLNANNVSEEPFPGSSVGRASRGKPPYSARCGFESGEER